jgi:hypothetical protein
LKLFSFRQIYSVNKFVFKSNGIHFNLLVPSTFIRVLSRLAWRSLSNVTSLGIAGSFPIKWWVLLRVVSISYGSLRLLELNFQVILIVFFQQVKHLRLLKLNWSPVFTNESRENLGFYLFINDLTACFIVHTVWTVHYRLHI